MPLPHRYLLGFFIPLWLLFPAGCGKRDEPAPTSETVADPTPVQALPSEAPLGPNSQTFDLRSVGIWAKIDTPARTTLTSLGRDECLLQCGANFAITVSRSGDSAEAAKDRLTKAGWKFVDQTDAGFVAETESPEPARETWRFFNPYPAGYVVSIVSSPKLTSEHRQRMLETIKTFRPITISVEEMTRSQQAMNDLRQGGVAIILRGPGYEVDFPLSSSTEKMLPRVTELNRVATVRLRGPGTIPAGLLKLAVSCSGITSLHLQDLTVADTDWSAIDGHKSLQEIRIDHPAQRPMATTATTKVLLGKLAQLPSIQSIILRRYAVDDNVLQLAGQLSKPRLATIGFEDAGLTDQDVKTLLGYLGWKGISLADNPITANSLASMRELRNLEFLDLSGCRLNDRAITGFGELPLKKLSVARTDLSDAGIATLATTIPKLTSMDVSATAGTDACLASLAKFTKLRELSAAHLQLKTPLIEQLKSCGDLRALNLANTIVIPAELIKLIELFPRLELLDLRATSLDTDTADKIVKARPECQLLIAGTPAEDGKRSEAVIANPSPVTLTVPIGQLPAANPTAMLKRFDGKIVRDEEAESKPVVEVSISSVDITDVDLADLRELKTLERLRLDGCEKITEAGLVYLKSLTDLKHLYLSRTAVTANVSEILGQFKHLTILELPDVKFSQKQLARMEELKALEMLHGAQSPNYPEAFVDFLAKCKKLRQFDWLAVEWNNRRLRKLKDLTSLETVEIRGKWIGDGGMDILAGWPKLRDISIQNDLVTDAGLKPLEKLTGLRKLRIEGRRFSDGVLIPFRNNADLEGLRVRCPELSDRGTVPLKSFQKLLELDLNGNAIGDGTLQQLGDLKDLEWIDLGDTKITDQGLKHLKSMEELRKLTLSRTSVTGEGFTALLNLPRLTRLDLDHTKLTKTGLIAIAKVSSIEDLDLGHVQVNDEALKSLAELPGLQRIRLDGNATITDKAADLLVTFPLLTEVSVIESKLTGKGLAVLRKKDGLTVQAE